jgi:hypothetical protein
MLLAPIHPIMASSADDNPGLSSEDEPEIILQNDKRVQDSTIAVPVLSGQLQLHQCLIYACNGYILQLLSGLFITLRR